MICQNRDCICLRAATLTGKIVFEFVSPFLQGALVPMSNTSSVLQTHKIALATRLLRFIEILWSRKSLVER
jgi:hypothetical protein